MGAIKREMELAQVDAYGRTTEEVHRWVAIVEAEVTRQIVAGVSEKDAEAIGDRMYDILGLNDF